ncbi:hypothetical protein [Ensifer adhaerens]|uniref:hypothetical protein n=1 Tax=Ensifer adhaerens TaxID=106592 RepID=UPI001C4DEFD1|nr:hypothetical protein [Ensifer adhaerens]MBW0366131.1 hypothetical protein [Ensifer adhaerens]UCM19974.1 hypothetical protein LDL63_19560 [Ensifer adhaerens]
MNTEFKFDDFGFDGKLAIVDRSGNYEWVEPTITEVPSESCIWFELVGGNGVGDEDAREALREYLDNFAVSVPCDFRDGDDIVRAGTEAEAIRDRFLADNCSPFGGEA